MKKLLGFIFCAALLLAACSPPAPGTAAPTATLAPGSATVSEIVNDVKVRPAPDATFEQIATGFTFGLGGQLQTGDASKARLDLSDGSILRLAQNSSFTLQAAAPAPDGLVTRVQLTAGKLWVSLTGGGSVEVETPVGVASVRGSFAVFEYSPGDPNDPDDDVLVVGCIEGSCGAQNETVDEELGNLEQVTLTHGGQDVERIVLTGQAVQEFLQNNPEVGESISATLTAAPPATKTPVPQSTATETPAPAENVEPATATPAPTDTRAPEATSTRTPRPTARNTLTPTHTFTPAPTDTFTPAPTATCQPGTFYDPFQGRCRPPDTATPAFTATPIPTDTPAFTPTPDTQGPSISASGGSLTTSGLGCDISFSADINDPAGIISASFGWTAYDSQGTSTDGSGGGDMTGPAGGGNWTASASTSYIPPNGYVTWTITAVDALGNRSGANGSNIPADSLGCGLG